MKEATGIITLRRARFFERLSFQFSKGRVRVSPAHGELGKGHNLEIIQGWGWIERSSKYWDDTCALNKGWVGCEIC